MTTGRTVRFLRTAIMLAGLMCAGCVDRRFVIESNVPNAQVYIDNKSIGAAPAHTPFDYYGYYTITLVQPGYETLTQRVHVGSPWYGYPPIDFLAEVVWPFQIRDTRRYYFELHEATKPRPEDLLEAAEALRVRGQNLPQAERPALPKPQPPRNQPAPQPQPQPQPGPGPLVPGVGPQPGGAPPGIVPGVGPNG